MRYIQYFINFPLLLLLLLLPTGLSISDVLTTAFFGWVVVVSGLVGALIPSSYKWGFYAFGVSSLIYIWFVDFSIYLSIESVLINSKHQVHPPFLCSQNHLRCRSSSTLGVQGRFGFRSFHDSAIPSCMGMQRGRERDIPSKRDGLVRDF